MGNLVGLYYVLLIRKEMRIKKVAITIDKNERLG